MRVLVTGAERFHASYLVEYLLVDHPKLEVFASRRWRRGYSEEMAHHDGVTLVETDLQDQNAVESLVDWIRPDIIFYLAGQSFVPASWNAPVSILRSTILGQMNLLEAVRSRNLDPIIHIAGSSEEYGLVAPQETPITESNPLRPLSTFAVSKVVQGYLGYQYFQSYGLRVVRTRSFSTTGPKHSAFFVTSNFARQLARIKAGLSMPIIRVGNTTAKRDFTDIRDVVRAYWLAATNGIPGEIYNISSGRAIVIQELLERLIELTDVQVEIQQDPARMRPSDVEIVVGNSSKLRIDTGWEPEIPISQTLQDIVEYWREQIESERDTGNSPLKVAKPSRFYSCFISYCHEDSNFARRLYANLQARKIECWLDKHQLLPGDDIYEGVYRGIQRWDKVLLCCSKASLRSWWVGEEIRTALAKERQLQKIRGEQVLAIIPLNLDGYLFDGAEDSKARLIKDRLAADFTGWEQDDIKFREEFERVVKALIFTNGVREEYPEPKL